MSDSSDYLDRVTYLPVAELYPVSWLKEALQVGPVGWKALLDAGLDPVQIGNRDWIEPDQFRAAIQSLRMVRRGEKAKSESGEPLRSLADLASAKWLRREEVARYLGVSDDWVKKQTAKGVFRPQQPSPGMLLYDRLQVDEAIRTSK